MASDKYDIGTGFIEATRLSAQHYLWKETLDYLVHPDIPVHDEQLKIADVGTGTSVWLLDLAKTLPSSTQLDGFDVSASQYPHKLLLPSNVSLQTLDATDEPPLEFQGKYDVVHLRLFLIIVNNNDPTPIFNHCFKLLKPGGYLQWDEYDLNAAKVVSVDESAPRQKLQELLTGRLKFKPFGWVSELPRIFHSLGLEQVTVDRRPGLPWHTRMWDELDLTLAEQYATNFLDRKGPPGSGDERRQLARSAYREVQQGSNITRILQVVVGKKPQ